HGILRLEGPHIFQDVALGDPELSARPVANGEHVLDRTRALLHLHRQPAFRSDLGDVLADLNIVARGSAGHDAGLIFLRLPRSYCQEHGKTNSETQGSYHRRYLLAVFISSRRVRGSAPPLFVGSLVPSPLLMRGRRMPRPRAER